MNNTVKIISQENTRGIFKLVIYFLIISILVSLSILNLILKTTNHINKDVWIPITEFKTDFDRYVRTNIQNQMIVDDKYFLLFFQRLIYAQDESTNFVLNKIKTRIFIPYPSYVDVFFRKIDNNYYVFRLGRAEGIESGFFKYANGRIIKTESLFEGSFDKDIPTNLSIEKLNFHRTNNYVYPQKIYNDLIKDLNGKYYDVEVRINQGNFEAYVNGKKVCEYSNDEYKTGYWGLSTGDQPAIYIDKIEIDGIKNKAAFEFVEDFKNPRLNAQYIIRVLLISIIAFFLIWFGYSYFLSLIMKIDLRKILIFDIFTYLPFVITFFNPLNKLFLIKVNYQTISFYRLIIYPLIITLFLKFLFVIIHRKLLLFYDEGTKKFVFKDSIKELCSDKIFQLVFIIFPILLLLLFTLVVPKKSVSIFDSQREVFVEQEKLFNIGDTLFSRQTNIRDFKVYFDVFVEEGKKFEIFFRKFVRPEENNVPYWYAFKLDTTSQFAEAGFIKSEGYGKIPHKLNLEFNQWLRIGIITQGDKFFALIDGEIVDEYRDENYRSGQIGFVPMSDGLRIKKFDLWASATESYIDEWSGFFPHLLWVIEKFVLSLRYFLIPLFVIILSLSYSLLISVILKINARKVFYYDFSTLIPLFCIVLIFNHHNYYIGLIYLGILIALILKYLYILVNIRHPLSFNLLTIIFCILVFIVGEKAIENSPYDRFWRGSWQGGYVRDEFMFSPLRAEEMWNSYTRSFIFCGEKFSRFKQEGITRIICQGGSATLGVGVSKNEEKYPKILERLLNDKYNEKHYEVINAGKEAYTTLDGLLQLKRDLLILKPDIVTLMFGGNDGISPWWLPDTQSRVWSYIKRSIEHYSPIQHYLLNCRIFTGIIKEIKSIVETIKEPTKKSQVPVEEFEGNLRECVRLSKENNFKLIFIYEMLYESLYLRNPFYKTYYEAMKKVAQENNIPLVDTISAFREQKYDEILVDSIHPTALGNEIIAKAIKECINRDEQGN